MGRPPSNGGPAFRFNQVEVTEMETILQDHNASMPARHILEGLADKFSDSPDRKGKTIVQFKQVWNWFQNRRYALRARAYKAPGKLNVSSMPPRDDSTPVRSVLHPVANTVTAPMRSPMPAPAPAPSVLNLERSAESSYSEFEAKSARDGAWYDVQNFLAHRNLESGDPDVQVRFVGFGQEEDEWVNGKKHARQRSLPCEAAECVAVLPGDLILCFQEGKDQALYYDAHVLDAKRRRHDVRGCRCRFLVRYDHDQSEEIVPLRKICRRPETDYRLQQLHAANELASVDPIKLSVDLSAPRTTNSFEMMQKQRTSSYAHTNANTSASVSSVFSQTTILEPNNPGTVVAAIPGNLPVLQPPAAPLPSGPTENIQEK